MSPTEIAALVRLAGDSRRRKLSAPEDDRLVAGVRALVAENERLRNALLGKNEDLLWEMVRETSAADALPGHPDAVAIAKSTFRKVLSRAAARALGIDESEGT